MHFDLCFCVCSLSLDLLRSLHAGEWRTEPSKCGLTFTPEQLVYYQSTIGSGCFQVDRSNQPGMGHKGQKLSDDVLAKKLSAAYTVLLTPNQLKTKAQNAPTRALAFGATTFTPGVLHAIWGQLQQTDATAKGPRVRIEVERAADSGAGAGAGSWVSHEAVDDDGEEYCYEQHTEQKDSNGKKLTKNVRWKAPASLVKKTGDSELVWDGVSFVTNTATHWHTLLRQGRYRRVIITLPGGTVITSGNFTLSLWCQHTCTVITTTLLID